MTDSIHDMPGLYIHVPYCRSKCKYCNFYSVTNTATIPHFLTALETELALYRPSFDTFDTLYIGGGTPSVLTIRQLERIMSSVRTMYTLPGSAEITIETNPGDADFDFMQALRTMGINRLTIGVQSFDNDVLSFLGRRHTAEEAISALETARKAGFENVGLDLISCVPGQRIEKWMDTLDRALTFTPEHLSCYELTIEPGTALGRALQRGLLSVADEQRQYEFFMKTSEILEDAGYIHYEVSNFARDISFSSRHNQKYWNHVPYLGLGPAAHSFADNTRWWNHRSLSRYISDIDNGNRPIDDSEYLSEDQLRFEALYLGLRTKRGININDFKKRYHYDLYGHKGKILDTLVKECLITNRNGYIVPTRRGLAVADTLSLL